MILTFFVFDRWPHHHDFIEGVSSCFSPSEWLWKLSDEMHLLEKPELRPQVMSWQHKYFGDCKKRGGGGVGGCANLVFLCCEPKNMTDLWDFTTFHHDFKKSFYKAVIALYSVTKSDITVENEKRLSSKTTFGTFSDQAFSCITLQRCALKFIPEWNITSPSTW